jgi:hypothetical protein
MDLTQDQAHMYNMICKYKHIQENLFTTVRDKECINVLVSLGLIEKKVEWGPDLKIINVGWIALDPSEIVRNRLDKIR